jgi:hypothetical protein
MYILYSRDIFIPPFEMIYNIGTMSALHYSNISLRMGGNGLPDATSGETGNRKSEIVNGKKKNRETIIHEWQNTMKN